MFAVILERDRTRRPLHACETRRETRLWVFMCMRDLSSIDASLVRAIGSFVGNDWTGALALGALVFATIHEDMEPSVLTDAASRGLV